MLKASSAWATFSVSSWRMRAYFRRTADSIAGSNRKFYACLDFPKLNYLFSWSTFNTASRHPKPVAISPCELTSGPAHDCPACAAAKYFSANESRSCNCSGEAAIFSWEWTGVGSELAKDVDIWSCFCRLWGGWPEAICWAGLFNIWKFWDAVILESRGLPWMGR